MEPQIETIDNNENSDSNSSNTTEDKTYHFRKGSDLDGFESFGSLFADGLFTDLAICCSGRIFRCHRVIMAASSLYMKNALSAFNNTTHSNCNTIMLMPQDIKVSDMEAILHFIYNGQVEVTRDAIESFLTSAKTLNIKGLANIKLVYNNQNNNQNNENKNHNNNHKINNNNHNNSNTNNTNNTNNNNNDNNVKRRNGIIATNRSQLKNDLNFSTYNAIPQTQSFHSSSQMDLNDSNDSPSNRRKQTFPSNTPINGFSNDSVNEDSQWITITDEEEGEDIGIDDKTNDKMEDNDNDNDNERTSGEEMSRESMPQMPCLIQIDADPTTFPSYCPETTDNGIKRRRSSSLRSLPEKTQKSGNNSIKNRNNDQIRKPMKMVRSSNRKLGFLSFHKSSTSIWNSSNKWKCEICNKLYGNKQTLKEHIDYFHSNRAEQIFTCTICTKEYTWEKNH